MTRYSFILLNGEQDGFLARLQELGLVDITRSSKPVDNQSAAMLERASSLADIRSRLAVLDLSDVEATRLPSLEGKDLADRARTDLSRLTALEGDIAAAERDVAAKTPWGHFSPDTLARLEEAGYQIRYHVLPTKSFRETWKEIYPLEEVAVEDGKTYFVSFVSPALQSEGIPEVEKSVIPSPNGSLAEAEARYEALLAEKNNLLSELHGLQERVPEIQKIYEEEVAALDLYLATASSALSGEDRIVTLEGFVPSECDEAVTAYLNTTQVFYLKEAARVEENPPIRFRNNKFVKMFEVLTDMYGRPSYDGFDPTPFIAVFFLLFFAFCMGDAGYGLLLILIGLGLKKVENFKDMAPLVVTLGIGTSLVGFFFHTFFSMDISSWAIFAPIKGLFLPSTLFGLESFDAAMVLAILIGVLHICLAMIVKTVNETRNKGFLASLGTWGWTLLIVGGVIVGGFALSGVISSDLTRWIIIVLGILSALGIFIFNDIHRNPLINIGSGLWETYNTATGLLGDVLSYLRLYALGLAGAKLGEAFNAIGLMVLGDGQSIPLWIGFLLIVIIGHTLNLAMCALGAFVHPLRLNFLEFFKNSGYEAAGRNFNPLKK